MKLPFTFDVRRSDLDIPTELGSRDQALREFKAGKLSKVNFGITAYVHDPEKIKNPIVINEAELESFASSFAGCPFLQDHSRKQSDRGGTIVESSLIEKNGKKAIYQRIEAVKPWAVEGVLDQTIDRFSIGWYAEEYLCTVCGTEYGGAGCRHDFYDLGSKDKESGARVKVLMKGLEGQETSAVTHPAVPGTEATDSLYALRELSEMRKRAPLFTQHENASGIPPENGKGKGVEMEPEILALLGLPAATAESEALSALKARLSQKPGTPKAMLAALSLADTASDDEAIAKVVAMQAPGAFVPRADHEKVVEELATYRAKERVGAAKASGKITPASEPWAIEFAKKDPEGFSRFVEVMPVQMPVASGVTPPSFDAATKPGTDPTFALTEDELKVAKRTGRTPEEFAKDKKSTAEYEARIAAIN